MVVSFPRFITGGATTVMVTIAVSARPVESVPITSYVVVAVGQTFTTLSVAMMPLFHA